VVHEELGAGEIKGEGIEQSIGKGMRQKAKCGPFDELKGRRRSGGRKSEKMTPFGYSSSGRRTRPEIETGNRERGREGEASTCEDEVSNKGKRIRTNESLCACRRLD